MPPGSDPYPDTPGSSSGDKGSDPGLTSTGSDPGLAQIERLLADALQPIEPPERLSERLITTFSAVTQAAADELSDWAEELSESERESLRDPRNWVRPVVAVAAGGVATGALVVLEARRRNRQRGGGLTGMVRGVRDRLG